MYEMANDSRRSAEFDFRTVVGRALRYLEAAGDLSSTKAQLSALRSSATLPIEEAQASWDTVLAYIPVAQTWSEDVPTQEERALHAVLGLYALHQQSRSESMNRAKVGLGVALRQLRTAHGDSVLRRFGALITSVDFEELRFHLAGLARMLRSNKIPTDYVQLGLDLLLIQIPEQKSRVLLRWSRDFYAAPRETDAHDEVESQVLETQVSN